MLLKRRNHGIAPHKLWNPWFNYKTYQVNIKQQNLQPDEVHCEPEEEVNNFSWISSILMYWIQINNFLYISRAICSVIGTFIVVGTLLDVLLIQKPKWDKERENSIRTNGYIGSENEPLLKRNSARENDLSNIGKYPYCMKQTFSWYKKVIIIIFPWLMP